jgi:hypothetical protein
MRLHVYNRANEVTFGPSGTRYNALLTFLVCMWAGTDLKAGSPPARLSA